MAGKKSEKSMRAIAARLSADLGRVVTAKAVGIWRSKGYPMDDPVALEKKIRNQERGPRKTRVAIPSDGAGVEAEPSPDESPPMGHLDIEHELKQLQRTLLNAEDYEAARTIRVKIAGVRDVLKSLREQGHYVTRESQIRDGMEPGEAIKSLVLKIPTDLPQMIVGLDYATAVERCEDYAYGILTSLSESNLTSIS